MTLRLSLMSIQALLDAPDASSPQDYEVAKVYTSDRKGFNEQAKAWTTNFANVSLNDYVNSLLDD